MIIGSILYTLLESILKWLLNGVVYLGEKILDEAVEITATTNIFQKSINMIPYSQDLHVGAIIRGLAIAVIILLLVVSAIKSITSPITGEEAPNVLQVIIRAVLAVIMLFLIFGTDVGSESITSMRYNGSQLEQYVVGKTLFNLSTGLLGTIGTFFGKVLSYISPHMNDVLTHDTEFSFNPDEYLAWIILTASLLTQVVGSAITILERFVTLGISAMFGPICVAMYTSKDTSDTFKNWCSSIFTQFLALFLSMVMWVLFISSCNTAFENNSVFQVAVSIVILTLVKNSEKIFNSFGFKTMSMGDSARAVVGGFGTIMGAGAAALSVARFARMGKGGGGKAVAGEKHERGVGSAFSENGQFGNKDIFTKQFGDAMIAANPAKSITRSVKQNNAIKDIKGSVTRHEDIKASTMNAALFGDEAGGKYTTISGYNNSDTMKYAEATSLDGKTIEGQCGSCERINSRGEKETFDVFIPTSQETSNFMEGASIGVIDGKERFISGGPVIDNSGQSYYRISSTDPNIDFGQIDKAETKAEPQVTSEQDFPNKN